MTTFMACGQNYPQTEEGFQEMLEATLDHDVPEISVEEAATDSIALFFDAREREEFKVSHIEGAHWVGYDDFNPKRMKGVPKDAAIIVYCSIGYRSEKITEALQELGYTNVSNLYGGIFAWTNSGHPVVRKKSKKTDHVHPYNDSWGKWVFKGEKCYK